MRPTLYLRASNVFGETVHVVETTGRLDVSLDDLAYELRTAGLDAWMVDGTVEISGADRAVIECACAACAIDAVFRPQVRAQRSVSTTTREVVA